MSAIGAGWLYLGWGAILFHTNYGLMQQSPFEIKERLLKALDKEYNVVDMGTVLEIVTILERTPITKEALETTRLGRDINELRRKTRNESLAKRAKDLVRRWRDLILPQNAVAPIVVADSSQQNGSSRNTAQARIPAAVPSNPISPAISLHSDKSSVSPASTRVEAVPKTHASNKRLRKDMVQSVPSGGDKPLETSPELPPSKKIKLEPTSLAGPKSRLNGDHYDSVGSDCEIVSVTPSPAKTKVKNRKKSTKDRTRKDDIVKEKIASIARIPKVKTTQELLAGLQSRSKDVPSLLPDHDIAKNKTEHIARFLRSQTDEPEIIDVESTNDSVVEAKPETPSEPPPPPLRTVEEILARLPPLDIESIKWDETPIPSPEPEPRQVSEEEVDRVLTQHVEGLTGNFDHSYTNSEFREWHECVSRTSHDSDLIHILPYVIID